MRSAPFLQICALLLGRAAPGSAQTLDQHHDGGSSPFFLQQGLGAIQTFQPAIRGKLHHIDVLLEPPDPFHFALGPQLLLLAMLGACAETVDGVVSPDGTSGCLPAAGAVSVGEALGTLFPR